HDVGVLEPDGAADTSNYRAVLFRAGRVPSCFVADRLQPAAYAHLAEWNVPAVLTRQPAVAAEGGPFFLGGRLHFREEAGAGAEGLAIRAVRLDPTAGGAASVLDGLGPDIEPLSVRQAANRFADLPYDHGIPVDAIQGFARELAAAPVPA